MDVLLSIGKVSGIILVLFGFIHFLLLDTVYRNKTNIEYLAAKYWIGQITLALAVITISCALSIMLISFIKG